MKCKEVKLLKGSSKHWCDNTLIEGFDFSGLHCQVLTLSHVFWKVTSVVCLLMCDLGRHANCLSVAQLRSLLDLWLGVSQIKDATFNRIQSAFGSSQHLRIRNGTGPWVWVSERRRVVRWPHRGQWKLSARSPAFACKSCRAEAQGSGDGCSGHGSARWPSLPRLAKTL